MQTAGLKVSRVTMVIVDTIICGIITYIAVTGESFYDLLNAFLGLVIIWLAPWIAVYLADWLMRRKQYDLAALANQSGGRYWGRRGFRISGLGAQMVGMVVAGLWVNTDAYVGPLAHWTHGADLSIPAGMAAAALVYLALAPTERSRAHQTDNHLSTTGKGLT